MEGFLTRWARLFVLLLASVTTIGCGSLLGLEERTLDTLELTADGYEGCQPSEAICSDCTSAWHSCICEDWERKPEEELRADCASKAPPSIRAEQKEKYPGTQKPGENPEDDAGAEDAGPSQPSPKPGFADKFCKEPADSCAECLCDDCTTPVSECLDDSRCTSVLSCVVTSDCDPFADDGPKNCELECADVIKENGGVKGAPVTRFRRVVSCLIEEDCPCGDGTVDPPGCSAENGCTECAGCVEECRCEGKTEARCAVDCAPRCDPATECSDCNTCVEDCECRGEGDRATCTDLCEPPPCSPAGGCLCGSCLDDCQCNGETPATCEASCGGSSCTPADSCAGCEGCFSRCLCEGRGGPECESECPPKPPCSSTDGCGTCDTCLGRCGCEGAQSFTECMTSCGLDDCGMLSCESCSTCATRCDCEGNDPFSCRDQCLTNDCVGQFPDDECASCSCEVCPLDMTRCANTPGCPILMQCMQEKNCFSIEECNRPGRCRAEINQLGGLLDPRLGIAEALLGCRFDGGCPCDSLQPPPSINCGGEECFGYTPPPPETILDACCTDSAEQPCGLNMAPLFGSGAGCAPLGEPGIDCSDCRELSPDRGPWMPGETLAGCCREDRLCGFNDFALGLGCAAPESLGQPADQTCSDICEN